MNKFKVGDRVVVVRSNHPLQASYLSERGEVKSVSQEGEYEVTVILDGMGCGTCFDSSELEFEHVYDELSKEAIKIDLNISGEDKAEVLKSFSSGTRVDTRLDEAFDKWVESRHEDAVNHPSHYTSHPSGVECIDITRHMGFLDGNAMKYLWRFSLKNGVEDLYKCRQYLDWLIEAEEAKRADS